MFGADPESAEKPELEVSRTERSLIAAIATLSIIVVWLYKVFANNGVPMSHRSALQAAILLTVPYLFLIVILKAPLDRIILVVTSSFAILSVFWFPFVAFVSWFVSYRPGAVAALCPLNAVLWIPTVKMWRRTPRRVSAFLWSIFWAVPLGYYVFYSVLVWLQEKALYVPPPK